MRASATLIALQRLLRRTPAGAGAEGRRCPRRRRITSRSRRRAGRCRPTSTRPSAMPRRTKRTYSSSSKPLACVSPCGDHEAGVESSPASPRRRPGIGRCRSELRELVVAPWEEPGVAVDERLFVRRLAEHVLEVVADPERPLDDRARKIEPRAATRRPAPARPASRESGRGNARNSTTSSAIARGRRRRCARRSGGGASGARGPRRPERRARGRRARCPRDGARIARKIVSEGLEAGIGRTACAPERHDDPAEREREQQRGPRVEPRPGGGSRRECGRRRPGKADGEPRRDGDQRGSRGLVPDPRRARARAAGPARAPRPARRGRGRAMHDVGGAQREAPRAAGRCERRRRLRIPACGASRGSRSRRLRAGPGARPGKTGPPRPTQRCVSGPQKWLRPPADRKSVQRPEYVSISLG